MILSGRIVKDMGLLDREHRVGKSRAEQSRADYGITSDVRTD